MTATDHAHRLLAIAAIDGKVLKPELAREIITQPMEVVPRSASGVPDTLMDDALDEAVFIDQEEVEAQERAQFDTALARLEREGAPADRTGRN